MSSGSPCYLYYLKFAGVWKSQNIFRNMSNLEVRIILNINNFLRIVEVVVKINAAHLCYYLLI